MDEFIPPDVKELIDSYEGKQKGRSEPPKIELFKPLVPSLHPLYTTQILSLPNLVIDQKRTWKERFFSRPWQPFKKFKKVPDLNIYHLDKLSAGNIYQLKKCILIRHS